MEFRLGVIVVAAGSGTRFGRPKARVRLEGATLLERSCAAFPSGIDRVVVLRPDDLAGGVPEGWRAVPGGARRRDSVAAGLAALDPAVTHVLVHDAARPLVPPDVVARVETALAGHPAVVPGVAVADTIKRVEALPAGDLRVVDTPERDSLVAVQTPQGFARPLLARALEASGGDATDEAALVERLGEPVAVVAGDPGNLKITRPADLDVARALLAAADRGSAPIG